MLDSRMFHLGRDLCSTFSTGSLFSFGLFENLIKSEALPHKFSDWKLMERTLEKVLSWEIITICTSHYSMMSEALGGLPVLSGSRRTR